MNCQLSYTFIKCSIPFLTGIILLSLSCTKETDIEIALDNSADDLNPGIELTNVEPGIALTFDDAYYDEWIEMLPILNKYNAKVTFFISLNYPKNDINRKEKIIKLYNAGNEIGLHTVNHPRLSTYLKNHSLYHYYINEILPEVRFFNSLGINPSSFAYPYGQYSAESNEFLSQYFNKIRCMYGSANIKRVKKVIGASVIMSASLKDYKDEILYAKLDSSIWVLAEHRPVQKVTDNDTFTFSMLDSICKFVSEQNMRFYCLREFDTAILEKQRINGKK
jgi:peptidoglycan/xylan/chitin deacetylase (PgdA/CDA1 family)